MAASSLKIYLNKCLTFHRSSNGEWKSSGDGAGDEGTGSHHRERDQGDNGNIHPKRKHEDKGNDGDAKEEKKKSEDAKSISSLKKLNGELKEKVKKQGRAAAADKMGEEY